MRDDPQSELLIWRVAPRANRESFYDIKRQVQDKMQEQRNKLSCVNNFLSISSEAVEKQRKFKIYQRIVLSNNQLAPIINATLQRAETNFLNYNG